MSNQKHNLLSVGEHWNPCALIPSVSLPNLTANSNWIGISPTLTSCKRQQSKDPIMQYLSGWVDSSQRWGIWEAFFLYHCTSCDHITVWLPCCIYTCVPVSVNYSVIKAAVGWWNVWISISVFWTVQQINCEDPIIHPQAKIRLHQSGFYTSTSAASKTEHRNVKSSEFTRAACGKVPTLQAVAMACYRIYA